MINNLLFVCLLLLTVPATAQDFDEIPVLPQEGLQQYPGKLKILSAATYVPANDSLIYIDSRSWKRDASWTLEHAEEIQLDSLGKIKSLSVSDLDDRKKARMRLFETKWRYAKGRRLSLVRLEEGKRTDSVAFHYKRSGQLENYTVFNSNDKVQYKVTYTYDRDDRVITVRKKDDSNYPVAMVKYKYSKDQLQEKQYFDRDFILSETRRYSVKKIADSVINSSSVIMDSKGVLKTGMTYVKDLAGNMLEQSTINSQREVTDYRNYKYDEHEQLIEERIFATNLQRTIKTKLTYDDQGNWIRKEIYHDDRLYALEERSLEYW